MKIKQIFNKLISFTVSLCLLISIVSADAFSAVKISDNSQSKNEDIPLVSLDNGKITSVNDVGSNLTVVNIQDLHCHKETQKKISNIIEEINKENKIKEIYVEGGYGKIDTSWLKAIDDKKIREQIIEQLLEDGEITAGEYYTSFKNNDVQLKGLDERKTHQQNVKRLSEIMDNQRKYASVISKVRNEIARLNKRYVNSENRKFSQKINQYKREGGDSGKLYIKLFKYIDRINSNFYKYNNITKIIKENYPNMATYIILDKESKKINSEEIGKQIKSVLIDLKSVLSYSEYSEIISKTNNLKDINKLVWYINKYTEEKNIDLNKYGSLSKFLEIRKITASLNPVKLLEEERDLIEQIRYALSYNKTEYEVAYISDFEEYFEKYLKYGLTSKDWNWTKKGFDKFRQLYAKYAIVDRIKEIEKDFVELDKYYNVNDDRNSIFVNNILDEGKIAYKIAKPGTRTTEEIIKDSKEVIIVVAGGYHSDELSNILSEKSVNDIVITPNITGDIEKANNKYKQTIKEQAILQAQALAFRLASCSNDEMQQILLLKAGIEVLKKNNGTVSDEEIENIVKIIKNANKNIDIKYENGIFEINGKIIPLESVDSNYETLEEENNIKSMLEVLDAAIKPFEKSISKLSSFKEINKFYTKNFNKFLFLFVTAFSDSEELLSFGAEELGNIVTIDETDWDIEEFAKLPNDIQNNFVKQFNKDFGIRNIKLMNEYRAAKLQIEQEYKEKFKGKDPNEYFRMMNMSDKDLKEYIENSKNNNKYRLFALQQVNNQTRNEISKETIEELTNFTKEEFKQNEGKIKIENDFELRSALSGAVLIIIDSYKNNEDINIDMDFFNINGYWNKISEAILVPGDANGDMDLFFTVDSENNISVDTLFHETAHNIIVYKNKVFKEDAKNNSNDINILSEVFAYSFAGVIMNKLGLAKFYYNDKFVKRGYEQNAFFTLEDKIRYLKNGYSSDEINKKEEEKKKEKKEEYKSFYKDNQKDINTRAKSVILNINDEFDNYEYFEIVIDELIKIKDDNYDLNNLFSNEKIFKLKKISEQKDNKNQEDENFEIPDGLRDLFMSADDKDNDQAEEFNKDKFIEQYKQNRIEKGDPLSDKEITLLENALNELNKRGLYGIESLNLTIDNVNKDMLSFVAENNIDSIPGYQLIFVKGLRIENDRQKEKLMYLIEQIESKFARAPNLAIENDGLAIKLLLKNENINEDNIFQEYIKLSKVSRNVRSIMTKEDFDYMMELLDSNYEDAFNNFNNIFNDYWNDIAEIGENTVVLDEDTIVFTYNGLDDVGEVSMKNLFDSKYFKRFIDLIGYAKYFVYGKYGRRSSLSDTEKEWNNFVKELRNFMEQNKDEIKNKKMVVYINTHGNKNVISLYGQFSVFKNLEDIGEIIDVLPENSTVILDSCHSGELALNILREFPDNKANIIASTSPQHSIGYFLTESGNVIYQISYEYEYTDLFSNLLYSIMNYFKSNKKEKFTLLDNSMAEPKGSLQTSFINGHEVEKINKETAVKLHNLINLYKEETGIDEDSLFAKVEEEQKELPDYERHGFNVAELSIRGDDKYAPVWEEAVFGTAVTALLAVFMISNPFGWFTGIVAGALFLATRLGFIDAHRIYKNWKYNENIGFSENIKARLFPTTILSVPYAIVLFGGLGTFLPALAVATGIAMVLHYIWNTYGNQIVGYLNKIPYINIPFIEMNIDKKENNTQDLKQGWQDFIYTMVESEPELKEKIDKKVKSGEIKVITEENKKSPNVEKWLNSGYEYLALDIPSSELIKTILEYYDNNSNKNPKYYNKIKTLKVHELFKNGFEFCFNTENKPSIDEREKLYSYRRRVEYYEKKLLLNDVYPVYKDLKKELGFPEKSLREINYGRVMYRKRKNDELKDIINDTNMEPEVRLLAYGYLMANSGSEQGLSKLQDLKEQTKTLLSEYVDGKRKIKNDVDLRAIGVGVALTLLDETYKAEYTTMGYEIKLTNDKFIDLEPRNISELYKIILQSNIVKEAKEKNTAVAYSNMFFASLSIISIAHEIGHNIFNFKQGNDKNSTLRELAADTCATMLMQILGKDITNVSVGDYLYKLFYENNVVCEYLALNEYAAERGLIFLLYIASKEINKEISFSEFFKFLLEDTGRIGNIREHKNQSYLLKKIIINFMDWLKINSVSYSGDEIKELEDIIMYTDSWKVFITELMDYLRINNKDMYAFLMGPNGKLKERIKLSESVYDKNYVKYIEDLLNKKYEEYMDILKKETSNIYTPEQKRKELEEKYEEYNDVLLNSYVLSQPNQFGTILNLVEINLNNLSDTDTDIVISEFLKQRNISLNNLNKLSELLPEDKNILVKLIIVKDKLTAKDRDILRVLFNDKGIDKLSIKSWLDNINISGKDQYEICKIFETKRGNLSCGERNIIINIINGSSIEEKDKIIGKLKKEQEIIIKVKIVEQILNEYVSNNKEKFIRMETVNNIANNILSEISEKEDITEDLINENIKEQLSDNTESEINTEEAKIDSIIEAMEIENIRLTESYSLIGDRISEMMNGLFGNKVINFQPTIGQRARPYYYLYLGNSMAEFFMSNRNQFENIIRENGINQEVDTTIGGLSVLWYFIFETMKNAFYHGNKLDVDKSPIYIYMDINEENKEVYFNVVNENFENREFDNEFDKKEIEEHYERFKKDVEEAGFSNGRFTGKMEEFNRKYDDVEFVMGKNENGENIPYRNVGKYSVATLKFTGKAAEKIIEKQNIPTAALLPENKSNLMDWIEDNVGDLSFAKLLKKSFEMAKEELSPSLSLKFARRHFKTDKGTAENLQKVTIASAVISTLVIGIALFWLNPIAPLTILMRLAIFAFFVPAITVSVNMIYHTLIVYKFIKGTTKESIYKFKTDKKEIEDKDFSGEEININSSNSIGDFKSKFEKYIKDNGFNENKSVGKVIVSEKQNSAFGRVGFGYTMEDILSLKYKGVLLYVDFNEQPTEDKIEYLKKTNRAGYRYNGKIVTFEEESELQSVAMLAENKNELTNWIVNNFEQINRKTKFKEALKFAIAEFSPSLYSNFKEKHYAVDKQMANKLQKITLLSSVIFGILGFVSITLNPVVYVALPVIFMIATFIFGINVMYHTIIIYKYINSVEELTKEYGDLINIEADGEKILPVYITNNIGEFTQEKENLIPVGVSTKSGHQIYKLNRDGFVIIGTAYANENLTDIADRIDGSVIDKRIKGMNIDKVFIDNELKENSVEFANDGTIKISETNFNGMSSAQQRQYIKEISKAKQTEAITLADNRIFSLTNMDYSGAGINEVSHNVDDFKTKLENGQGLKIISFNQAKGSFITKEYISNLKAKGIYVYVEFDKWNNQIPTDKELKILQNNGIEGYVIKDKEKTIINDVEGWKDIKTMITFNSHEKEGIELTIPKVTTIEKLQEIIRISENPVVIDIVELEEMFKKNSNILTKYEDFYNLFANMFVSFKNLSRKNVVETAYNISFSDIPSININGINEINWNEIIGNNNQISILYNNIEDDKKAEFEEVIRYRILAKNIINMLNCNYTDKNREVKNLEKMLIKNIKEQNKFDFEKIKSVKENIKESIESNEKTLEQNKIDLLENLTKQESVEDAIAMIGIIMDIIADESKIAEHIDRDNNDIVKGYRAMLAAA